MAKIVDISSFTDDRGSLSVVDTTLTGFEIKRVFYIYDVNKDRGGHGHFINKMMLIALNGSIEINGQSPDENFNFVLNTPKKALLLNPEDWHVLKKFSKNAVLLVICSERWDIKDYFYEPYRSQSVD